jgi:CelD/BcsL family acetyltransferase involved in cellulose biosynthesis
MKAGLGRNIKESIRRCYNSLRRDGLSCRMDTLERSDAVADGLAEFLRLHTRRAQRSDLPVHADVFASEQARGFLTEVCTRLAERGVARIFRLWVDDRVVAIRVGFQMQHHLYLYYSGWDVDYAQYSVMTTLLCEIIKDAIEHRIGAINLSTGKDVSKTRWGPSEVTYPAMLELSPSLSSRARYHAFQLIRSIGTRPTVRQMLPASFVRRSPRDLVENSDLRAGPRARGGNWLSIATPRSRFVGELPQSRQSAT